MQVFGSQVFPIIIPSYAYPSATVKDLYFLMRTHSRPERASLRLCYLDFKPINLPEKINLLKPETEASSLSIVGNDQFVLIRVRVIKRLIFFQINL